MRFKLDENLPESLVQTLHALGHDVDSVRMFVSRLRELKPNSARSTRVEPRNMFPPILCFESGNQQWLPKAPQPFEESYSLKLPDTLKPGRYTLKCKLHYATAARDVRVALRPDRLDKAA